MHAYQELLFHILFSSVATLAFAASIYLLLRRSNGIAPDITPPVRLRRWTAAFFATLGVSHLWWLLIRYGPMEGDLFDRILLCSTLDTISSAPVLLCIMLVMLQDRRRPLWPIALSSALTSIYLLFIYILDIRSTVFLLPLGLLIGIFFIFLLRAVRQYDRWLLDNYADLEHKEARTSLIVMAAFVLITVSYCLANDYFFFEVLIEVANILLIGVLLWRVETMPTLEMPAEDEGDDQAEDAAAYTDAIADKLSSLLQQHCVEEQFYLRHDASLTQLAKLLGTNNHYLSNYFAQQGITYNAYINKLRIGHFKRLYQEQIKMKVSVTAAQVATQSGFRSYSTFSNAFKQATGRTAKDWMDSITE